MNTTDLFLWIVILPLIASPVIYLAGRLVVRNGGTPMIARLLAILTMAVETGLLVIASSYVLNNYGVKFSIGEVRLEFDGVSIILAGIAVVLGLLVMVYSTRYMRGENGEEKFYALLSMMIGTIIGLCCTRDLFNLWVWFEAMAISSYMLVAFYRSQPASLEAGVKYLVQSATGSVMVLLGIALVFGKTGALDFASIQSVLLTYAEGEKTALLLCAGGLFLVGFGVKTALVPLHTWLPDAHSQAPSGISAMLSGVVIEAGMVAMLRSVGVLNTLTLDWGPIILGFAALNLLVGNFMALRQTQVKRLLAYSSISHMGYILLGIGFAVTFSNQDGATGAFFHLLNHGMMKGLAFLGVGALLFSLHISREDHGPLVVEDLNGASKRYPITVFCLSVGLLALGGLPPFSGLWSKWQIFVSGFETQNPWAIGLVIFAALNSVLSLAYYAPLVNRMYRKEPSEIVTKGNPIDWRLAVPLVILAAGVIVIGFYPALVTPLTQAAGSDLLRMFGLF